MNKTFDKGHKLYVLLGYLIDVSLCYIFNLVFFYLVIKGHFPKVHLRDYKFWFLFLGPYYYNLLVSFPLIITNGARPGLAILKIKMKYKGIIKIFMANILYSIFVSLIFSLWYQPNGVFGSINMLIGYLIFFFQDIVIWDFLFKIQYEIPRKK